MFKLIKLLGLFVGKMYNRQARLLVIEAKAAKVLSDATSAKAAQLVSRAKELEETKEAKLEESIRIAMQAQALTKFFK